MSRRGGSARVVVGVLLGLALAGGCAPAVRFVQESPDGGVIRMPTNTNTWPTYYRSRAVFLMQQKCPGGYQIEKEGAPRGPMSQPGSLPPHESYFGNTGGSDEDQIYFIAFRAQSLPAKAPAPPARPAPARSSEAGDELPPPRPLPVLPAADEKNP